MTYQKIPITHNHVACNYINRIMRNKSKIMLITAPAYDNATSEAMDYAGALKSTIFGGGFTRQILRFLLYFLSSKYLILIYIVENPFRNMVIRW